MSELSPVVIEQIAVRVVELLRDEGKASGRLIDATEAARRLGISRATVYARSGELGAIRIGDGPRARLRFDPAALAERAGGTTRATERRPAGTHAGATRRKRRAAPTRSDLLPVRGRTPQ